MPAIQQENGLAFKLKGMKLSISFMGPLKIWKLSQKIEQANLQANVSYSDTHISQLIFTKSITDLIPSQKKETHSILLASLEALSAVYLSWYF